MKVDIQALETFNHLAHEGAQEAANALSVLTDVEPMVEVTKTNLVSMDYMTRELQDRDFVGVEIGFDGGLAGEIVLALDRDSATRLLGALPTVEGESSALRESHINEVGNIVVGGFLNGWADHIGTGIEITPPSYVEGSGADLIPRDAPRWNEHGQVILFVNQLQAADESVNAFIYMFPERDSFDRIVGSDEMTVDVTRLLDKLAVFNQMTKQGVQNAARYITALTGLETAVEISQLTFLSVENVPRQIANEEHVGAVFEFEGLPSGTILILFDGPSADTIATELVNHEYLLPADRDESGAIRRSAIQEISNIMTNGILDGWANVLGTSIDISPPQFVQEMGPVILDPIAVRLGESQEFAFTVDSTIQTPDGESNCDIYAFPAAHELEDALSALSIDSEADLEERIRAEMEVDYDDIHAEMKAGHDEAP